MNDGSSQDGGLRVHFAGTKTKAVLFGLDWTALAVLGGAVVVALGVWISIGGTAGTVVAVALVVVSGLLSSRWGRVVHAGARAVSFSKAEARVDRRRHAQKRRDFRHQRRGDGLRQTQPSETAQRKRVAVAMRSRVRSHHLVDGEFVYHGKHVMVHNHANGRLRVGFRLPDTRPWLQEPEEVDSTVSAWSDLLVVLARQMPPSIELSWRVDVVPTLESWDAARQLRDTRLACESGDTPTTALREEIAQQAWSVQSTLWLDRSGAEREGRAARERMSLLTAAQLCETSFRSRGLGDLVPLTEAQLHDLLTPPGLRRLGPSVSGALKLRHHDLAVEWDEIRVGEGFATSLVLEEWPTHSVHAGFALGLFRPCPPRRSITLTLQSLSLDQALRRTRRYRTEHLANRRMRGEAGYLERVSDSQAASSMMRQERELTSGHALFDYQLGVVLFAASRLALTRSLQRFDALADTSQTQFAKAYGQQYEVFAQLFGVKNGRAPRGGARR